MAISPTSAAPVTTEAPPTTPALWVADSEPDVALAVQLLAKCAGISNVRIFRSKRHALHCLQTAATEPLLVVTDYLGGEMLGSEFVPAARKAAPRTTIILFSAVIANEEAWVASAGPDRLRPSICIQKPDVACLMASLKHLASAIQPSVSPRSYTP